MHDEKMKKGSKDCMQAIGPRSELREEMIACMATNPQGEIIYDRC